ncbi:MAG TPA: glycogen-binding domain-containing protein [Candidatus Limnocylindrales bacterium]|nr:glycogen-binding domain-containing protein [Candidatus Limnocylindrales bacterium]
MNDRHGRDEQLERYLSGEPGREALSDDLAREEDVLYRLLGSLREDIRAPAVLREGVMREVELIPTPLWRKVVDWAVRPRSIRISPLAGAALAAATAAALVFVSAEHAPTGVDQAAVATSDTTVVTRFVFVAPEARTVHLTGDFAGWIPEGIPLEDLRGTGIWSVDVSLPPGVHEYTFIVDGSEWRPDPRAVSQVDDGFGRVNSIVIVSSEGAA